MQSVTRARLACNEFSEASIPPSMRNRANPKVIKVDVAQCTLLVLQLCATAEEISSRKRVASGFN